MLVNLKPGSQVADSYLSLVKGVDTRRSQSRPGLLQLSYIQGQLDSTKGSKEAGGNDKGHEDGGNDKGHEDGSPLSNGQDLALCSPPKTENEVQ